MSDPGGSRRNFIRLAAGAVSSAVTWEASSYARIIGANERIGVGVIGYSERFQEALLPAFQKQAAAQNFEIVAVSDIWNRRRSEGADALSRLTGRPVTGARNNDELYQMKQVEAVIISTADHQHAQHGVEAVRAGRDAYIEKPLASTMSDARAVLKAVTETKRVVQIGTQRRSARNFARARDYLRSGEFGEICFVELTYNVNQPKRWRRPQLVAALREADTDWPRFVMNRTRDAFDPHKYFEYRLYWPYSSGIPDQWMVHPIDTLHYLTGLAHPRSAVAQGGIYQWRDGRINPDTFTAIFDYGPPDDAAKGFQVVFTSRMTNSAGGVHDLYLSGAGSLDASAGTVSPVGGLTEQAAKGTPWKPTKLTEGPILTNTQMTGKAARGEDDEAVTTHMLNWMECIRSRSAPVADVRAGFNHSVALCMATAAWRSGKRATFDAQRQDVVCV